jgi:hypothetical protein
MNPPRSWLSRLRFQYSLQTALIVVLLWSAGLGTWSYFKQAPKHGEPVLILRDRYVGVLFPRNTLFCNTPTQWEPSVRDVERAEQRIPEFMRSEEPYLAGRLGEYVRQYFGVVQDGHRVIFCSFLHRMADVPQSPVYGDDYYLRQLGTPAMVLGGGEKFFRLLYDPKTDSCSNLHVNASD